MGDVYLWLYDICARLKIVKDNRKNKIVAFLISFVLLNNKNSSNYFDINNGFDQDGNYLRDF